MEKNKVKYTSTKPDQRVSFSAKQKDSWYIPMADWVINAAMSCNDKVITQKFLDAGNGIIDEATYDYVLKTYIKEGGKDCDKLKLYGELRNVDLLTPIIERYMGEFINMFSNYTVYNNDPGTVLKRNQYLKEKISPWINQSIINELNARGVNTGGQTQELPNIDSLIDEALNEWKDEVVVNAQNRLELINSIIKAKQLYQDCYYDWFVCQECYTYREVYRDDIQVTRVHPMEYYRVNSGNKYVEDDDYGVRKYRMSIPDIIDRFRNDLSANEITYLKKLSESSNSTDREDRFVAIKHMLEFGMKDIPSWSTRERYFPMTRDKFDSSHLSNNEITIYHIVFKTEVPEYELTYRDIFGNLRKRYVDETYTLDKEAGDIELDKGWRNQFWDMYQFGGREWAIWIKPKPTLVQREKFNNYSDCKNPYNGVVGLHDSVNRNPIPYRLLPYQALFKIYTLQEERAVAKFKSWLIMPDSIIGDSETMRMEERMAMAKRDDLMLVDTTLVNANDYQYIREIGNNALTNYLMVLANLKNQIKLDAWELANQNDARAGNTKDYAGKAVTEYNYQNALMGSVWQLEVYNGFRETDYKANIDYSKVAWVNGKVGSYVDPNTQQTVIVDIDGTSDICDDLGIEIVNNRRMQDMYNQMREFAFSMGQNGNEEVTLEAITNTDVNNLKKNIKVQIEARRQFELQLQTAGEEARAQTEQIISQREAEARQFEAEENERDRQNRIDLEIVKGEQKLQLERERWNVDTNRNGYVDDTEAAAAQDGITQSDVDNIKLNQTLNR